MHWLDAMRGLTMLLVVAYHVAVFTFGQNEKTSSSLPFLVLLRMPLFFFVSGFLAYRPRFDWTSSSVGRTLWRKTQVQVVPALLFLCLCLVFRQKGDFLVHLEQAFSQATKGGYWFTWVLLQLFVIYYVVLALLPVRLHHRASCLLWLFSVAAYETSYMPRLLTYPSSPFFQWTSLVLTIRYMQFFMLGNLVARHRSVFRWMITRRWFFPLVVGVAVLCCADLFRWHTLHRMWTNLPRTVAMYALLAIVVTAFFHYRQAWAGHNWPSRALRYVGTRTLDIYLLHFLLLPALPMVGKWVNSHHPGFLAEVLLDAGMAVPVVAACCLVSHLLRVSPVFTFHLFGRRT